MGVAFWKRCRFLGCDFHAAYAAPARSRPIRSARLAHGVHLVCNGVRILPRHKQHEMGYRCRRIARCGYAHESKRRFSAGAACSLGGHFSPQESTA